jgi:endoglucanase
MGGHLAITGQDICCSLMPLISFIFNLPVMLHARYLLLILIAFCLGCKKNTQVINTGTLPASGFLHSSGITLVDSNNAAVQLKGVAFGNEVWSDKDVPATHHSEEDFKRVKAMNMNAIRFYLNYRTFESDNTPYQYKQAGWDWLDKNIAWAKKYNIYLILNMHAPQGGYQSQGTGDALWTNAENQNRLTALWKAIAARYANEPTVIGFGLVNEPVPTASLQQWQTLAQRLTDEIRKVDQKHILFIEKPIYVKGVYTENSDLNFPVVNDNNKAYEFHIYDPFLFTHQLFSWANTGDGGQYPDERIISYTNGKWYTATFNNPAAATGNSNWTYYEGVKYKITDPQIKIGAAALVGAAAGGKVYFDDIQIKEFDENGNFVQDIITLGADDLSGWNYWSSNSTGRSGLALEGHSNGKSIFIEGSTADCNMSNGVQLFVPKQNYSYQVNGWMKGDNVAAAAACKIRIDFTTTSDPVLFRNKNLLERTLQSYVDFRNRKNTPLYMGEFGAGIHCFENNKGGLQWVTDMLDIAKDKQLHFTYHAYHEDSFGLYFGYGTLPDPAKVNQPLIDLMREKLK